MDNKTTEENDWEFGDTGAGEDGMVRLFINIGKKQRVRPGDILGAIAGESGMDGKLIGTIDMYDKYTFVEVPREYAREVLNAMKNVKIKGKTVAVEPANQKQEVEPARMRCATSRCRLSPNRDKQKSPWKNE